MDLRAFRPLFIICSTSNQITAQTGAVTTLFSTVAERFPWTSLTAAHPTSKREISFVYAKRMAFTRLGRKQSHRTLLAMRPNSCLFHVLTCIWKILPPAIKLYRTSVIARSTINSTTQPNILHTKWFYTVANLHSNCLLNNIYYTEM